MIKIVATLSESVNNPLLDQGIIIISNNSTKEENDILLSKKDNYLIVPIFVLDHSGRTFSDTPFGDNWDSGQYGIMAFPNEMVTESNKIQLIKSSIEIYTQWAEGDIYDFAYCSTYDSTRSEVNISEILLQSIDFNILLQESEDNDTYFSLIQYMKDNSISKKDAKKMCLNSSQEFEDFRKIYAGQNCFGIIKKSEIIDSWVTESYGTENTELRYTTGIPIAEAYNSFENSPWRDFAGGFDLSELLDSDIDQVLELIRRADIRAFHAEEAACGNI